MVRVQKLSWVSFQKLWDTIFQEKSNNILSFNDEAIFILVKLSKTFSKRIVKECFLYDFNIGSIYILFGLPMFLFGIIFGAFKWIHYASINELAPTGTIMIITITIILGFQLILQAIQYDVFNAPDGTHNITWNYFKIGKYTEMLKTE